MGNNARLPRLTATFCPQQWIDDLAVTSGPESEFDVTEVLLRMEPTLIVRTVQAEHFARDLDILAERAGLAEEHQGPFRVDLPSENVASFFQQNGITDFAAITESDLVGLRAKYGFPEPVTMPNGEAYVLDEAGLLHGRVDVEISDMVGRDLEPFLDMVSERLTGTALLSDISYEAIAVSDGRIVLKCAGDPSLVMDAELEAGPDGP